MKLFWLCAAAFVAAGGGESLSAEEKTEAADPVWHQDYAGAKTIARKTKKPLFVVFR